MTNLLGIGASAVNAYSSALSVIGDNVANAETSGYARRNVTISESASATGSNALYRSSLSTGGSDASGVTRAWDAYKSADARAATSDDARASATSTWLDNAQSAVDDTDTGIGTDLTSVFTAATTLAADPTSATARAQMYDTLDTATTAISTAATKLATISSGIADAATSAVTGANDDLKALAKVNAAIVAAADGSASKATLADQRDQLLDDLSSQVGIDARIGSDGSATVTLAGSSGVTLLSGANPALLSMATASDGRLSFAVGMGSNVQRVSPTGGTVAGLADAAASVAGTRGSLDTLATSFASQLNGWNAKGTTSAGTAGGALLSATNGAASLKLVATSGAAIAAAGSDGTANGNLLGLSDLRGSNGVEAQFTSLVGTTAQALASAKAQATAASTRKSTALVARDDVSGVSLDQEAAELVRYQQAYDGSAKVIQAAQTTLQSILDLF